MNTKNITLILSAALAFAACNGSGPAPKPESHDGDSKLFSGNGEGGSEDVLGLMDGGSAGAAGSGAGGDEAGAGGAGEAGSGGAGAGSGGAGGEAGDGAAGAAGEGEPDAGVDAGFAPTHEMFLGMWSCQGGQLPSCDPADVEGSVFAASTPTLLYFFDNGDSSYAAFTRWDGNVWVGEKGTVEERFWISDEDPDVLFWGRIRPLPLEPGTYCAGARCTRQ